MGRGNFLVLRFSSAFCCSATIFITCLYTRFFSAADALRMKSENGVEATGLGLGRDDMTATLEQFVGYGY